MDWNKAEQITQNIVFYASLFLGAYTIYIGLNNVEQLTNVGFQYVDVSGESANFIDPAMMLVLMGLVLFGTGCQVARLHFNTFGDFYFTIFNFTGFCIAGALVPMFAHDLNTAGLLFNGLEKYYYDVFSMFSNVVYVMLILVLYRSFNLSLYYRDLTGSE
jgi:hypothetical protein